MDAVTDNVPARRTLRVFVSYRRADADAARRLEVASAGLTGVELCTLPSDTTHGSGDWREPCRALIASADAVVCLVGPTTAESSNVAWELQEAASHGIPVLFVGRAAGALAREHDRHGSEAVESGSAEQILSRVAELA
jgi:hypothetical protein